MSLQKGLDTEVAQCYLGRLYVRKCLNRAIAGFYTPPNSDSDDSGRSGNTGGLAVDLDELNKRIKKKFENLILLADTLEESQWVPRGVQISQKNFDAASNMHILRLKINYWDTRAIMCRPFVEKILAETSRQPPGCYLYLHAMPEGGVEIVAPYDCDNTETHTEFHRLVVESAGRGLEAMVESTRAFYKFKHLRPIVVNVVGAAYAYVLKSKYLTGWMVTLT
jgi:hypothetical protein